MDRGGRACVLRSHATRVGFNSAPSRLRWVSVRGGAASTISATYSADDLTLTRRFGGAPSPLGPRSGPPPGARGRGIRVVVGVRRL